MILPKKNGELFIQYDNNGLPIYAFKVTIKSELLIEKFYNLTDEKIDTIVLPNLFKYNSNPFNWFTPDESNPKMFDLNNYCGNIYGAYYIKGQVRILENCFKGLRDVKIVCPYSDHSIAFNGKAFDEYANIELTLPTGVSLKRISGHLYKGGDSNEHLSWFLIADERLHGSGRNRTTISSFECEEYLGNFTDNISIDVTHNCEEERER